MWLQEDQKEVDRQLELHIAVIDTYSRLLIALREQNQGSCLVVCSFYRSTNANRWHHAYSKAVRSQAPGTT
ncbi:hypothetical protein ABTE96_22245, partial [Acinetobacter baumannii]